MPEKPCGFKFLEVFVSWLLNHHFFSFFRSLLYQAIPGYASHEPVNFQWNSANSLKSYNPEPLDATHSIELPWSFSEIRLRRCDSGWFAGHRLRKRPRGRCAAFSFSRELCP